MQTKTPVTISGKEATLLHALQRIVSETMEYPLHKPHSAESYLPPDLIAEAQQALALYGCQIEANHEAMRWLAA